MPEKATILIVDDSLVNLAVLDDILDRQGYAVVLANSGERALRLALDEAPDLVLLDVVMPEWDGYETCRRFKAEEKLHNIPVLFLSGLADTENKVRALQSGAVDYVSKPFQEEELIARVNTHVELARLRNGLEQEVAKKTEEIRSLLDALQLAYQQAQESSMLKTQFLHTISHEFRTPMNIILGTMDEMKEDTELDGEQSSMAETVIKAARDLFAILTNMLDFSKRFEGEIEHKMEALNLCQMVDEAISCRLSQAAAKNVEMHNGLPTEIPAELYGNKTYIGEIFNKLIDNAVKYTNSGEIKVSAEILENAEKTIFLRFHVLDTGTGIPQEKREQLFHSLTQLDGSTTREHGGVGMGLALCKLYADSMEGEIGMQSREEQGSDFWFTLKLEKKLAEET